MIPGLLDFHVRYLEVVLEIGFVERRIDRGRGLYGPDRRAGRFGAGRLQPGNKSESCEAGLGIVQMPHYHAERQHAAGILVGLLPQYPLPTLPMTVLYLHHRPLRPCLCVLIDWLVRCLGEDGDENKVSS